ncbi:uncharacterized protein [Eurosta solidaginis]|uniref:uncharacterized protein n=1 Tax=Eurosta solidaginis TaxID=178769 RepID=UPI0035305673
MLKEYQIFVLPFVWSLVLCAEIQTLNLLAAYNGTQFNIQRYQPQKSVEFKNFKIYFIRQEELNNEQRKSSLKPTVVGLKNWQSSYQPSAYPTSQQFYTNELPYNQYLPYYWYPFYSKQTRPLPFYNLPYYWITRPRPPPTYMQPLILILPISPVLASEPLTIAMNISTETILPAYPSIPVSATTSSSSVSSTVALSPGSQFASLSAATTKKPEGMSAIEHTITKPSETLLVTSTETSIDETRASEKYTEIAVEASAITLISHPIDTPIEITTETSTEVTQETQTEMSTKIPMEPFTETQPESQKGT